MSTRRKSERLVPVQARVELNEKQLLAALRVEPDNPLWLAVTQIIDRQVQAATSQAGLAETATSHGALAHCCGGMEWLRYLQAELEDYRLRAQQESLLEAGEE